MASVLASNDANTYFKKLKNTAAKISQDVKDVETALKVSKFELPENFALLTIIETKDNTELLKNEAGNIAEEIVESNKRYSQHINDVEGLVAEMEEKIDRIENYMESYNFKKAEDATVINGKNPDNAAVKENIKEQYTSADSAAAEHCEVTNDESENSEKENRIERAIQKTPKLKKLGLISQKERCLSMEVKGDIDSLKCSVSRKFLSKHPSSVLSHGFDDQIHGKLRSRNCSISPTPYLDKMEITPGLYRKNILATDKDFKLENSFRYTNSIRADDTDTPEEPITSCSTKKVTMTQDTDTPEEPITSCSTKKVTMTHGKSDTPEEPASLHSTRMITMIDHLQESTPEPPDLTSSCRFLLLNLKK